MAKTEGCVHCREVYQNIDIKFPSEFSKAIRVIKGNLSDGTIIGSSYWPEEMIHFNMPPFSEITPDGQWPDVIHYYFECPACHQLFLLVADTYHGSGGFWKPITI